MGTFGIGDLARRGAVTVDTIRYYEREGLLAPAERRPSGYRRYGAYQLARLRFVRRAQRLGFSLKETRELLELSRQRNVRTVKRVAERKVADIEARIADLERVKRSLVELIGACPGHGAAEDCPILRALDGERDER